MKREEMTCATCIYHSDTPELSREGNIECRVEHEFRWRNASDWCGDGVWHEWRESLFPSLSGPKLRFEISWGDWEDDPPKADGLHYNWHSNSEGDHYLVQDRFVMAHVFLNDNDNVWFGRIKGTQELVCGLTQDECKEAVEKHLRDTGVIS